MIRAGARLRLLAAVAVGWTAAKAGAYSLRIESDLLTLAATNEPMPSILEGFAYAGVSVRADPALRDARITAAFTNTPLDRALSKLFADYGYVITWDTIRGPVGELPRLSEIQVFRPGRKQDAKPLANNGKLRIVKDAAGREMVADEVLIGLKQGAQVKDFRDLLARHGGTVVGCLPAVGVYQVRFPPGTDIATVLKAIQAEGIVHTVEPNYASHLPAPAKDYTSGATSALRGLGTPPTGVPPVAILDSGLMRIDGLDQNIVASLDALDPNRAMSDPAGHGTQMAMLAAGMVAPLGMDAATDGSVPVVAIRNFDDAGYTSNYALMRAIEFSLEKGARVINLSWGSDTSSEFIRAAVDYARTKGAIVVAAAGNEGAPNLMYPAAYPGVIAVSAHEPNGSTWSGSNYGDGLYASAPALANFPVGHDGPPGGYAGTSIASAYLCRELALYFQRHPTATSDDALSALRGSLTDAGAPGRDNRYGYGRLDAAAVKRLHAQ